MRTVQQVLKHTSRPSKRFNSRACDRRNVMVILVIAPKSLFQSTYAHEAQYGGDIIQLAILDVSIHLATSLYTH